MAEIEKKNIIVIDISDEDEDKAAVSKREEEKKVCEDRSENHFDSNIKAKEKKMLADLSDFPGLAEMFAAEFNMRMRRKNYKLKRKQNNLSKVNGGTVDLGKKQVIPSESVALQSHLADDIEKEKIVNSCTPKEKLVLESLTDIDQATIESGPRLSLPSEATMSGHGNCCIVQMDRVATKVLLGAQKSNDEQNDVVNSCKPSETLTSSQQPPIESGSCRLSSSEEKMSGNDDSCRVQTNSVETEVLLVEETRSKERNGVAHITKTEEKKILADLSAFPGLAAMLAAEHNVRKQRMERNKLRRMKKQLSKADEIRREKQVNSSESLNAIHQAPIESGPCLSLPSEATMSRHDNCCIVQMDPFATEVLLRGQKSNKEQNSVADSNKPEETTLSEPLTNSQQPTIEFGSCRSLSSSSETLSGNVDCCRVQMNPVATDVLFIEEKRGEEHNAVAHITKAEEKKTLADLNAFPGLATTLAAEFNTRKQQSNRNRLRRMKKRLRKAGEIGKEKQVNSSESLTDMQQAPIEFGPSLSLPSEATMSRHDDCCIVQTDKVAREAFLRERKSNKEQNGVVGFRTPPLSSPSETTMSGNGDCCLVQTDPFVTEVLLGGQKINKEQNSVTDSCKPEETTVSEPLANSQKPPIESGTCRSLSTSSEKMPGNDCGRVQMSPVATEVLLIEEKRSEEQDKVAHITKAEEKKKLEDLSAFPGLAAMLVTGFNTRERRRKRNSLRRMKKRLLKAGEIEKEKNVSSTPEEKLVSENSTDIQQAPIESGPHLSSPSEATKSGNADCCVVQIDQVATEVLLGEQKRNKEQNSVLGVCTSHLSSLSEEGRSVTDNCCRLQINPVASVVLFTEEKSSEKQDGVICDKGKETLVNSYTETNRATSVGMDSVDRKQNMVLQNLLRRPRYFSSPAEGSITCYMCGEDDHIAAQCRMPKRKKICSICADGGHLWKQCRKVTTCIICNKKGHLAKDCSKRNAKTDPQSEMCLKCGNSGHNMFTCDNAYSPDDLKNIQCYICNEFGHLSCFEYAADGSRQVSCYTCGKLGHWGSECKENNKNLKSSKLAASSEQKSHSGAQQMLHKMGGEQGNNSSTLKTNTEQRVGTVNIRSAPHTVFGAHNARNETVNVTQGQQRRKFVWVRKPTQPNV